MPLAAIEVVKRHPLYRRIHCHLEDTCPLDGWTDDGATHAFVLYPIHSHGQRRAAAFAVDVHARVVTSARLVVDLGTSGLAFEALESLAPCHQHSAPPSRGPAWSGLDAEQALRVVSDGATRR